MGLCHGQALVAPAQQGRANNGVVALSLRDRFPFGTLSFFALIGTRSGNFLLFLPLFKRRILKCDDLHSVSFRGLSW